VAVAGENSKLHDASSDSTAPAVLVTASAGHVNSESDGVVVIVKVSVDVLVADAGQAGICRSNSALLPVISGEPKRLLTPGPKTAETDAGDGTEKGADNTSAVLVLGGGL
jgi:hypothetical protein